MHVSNTTPRRARSGFTLTELLVVIAIIAILVSITSVGVMTAMAKAKATRIKTELDNIDMGMKGFKEQYGAYPPCDLRLADSTKLAQVRQFVATAFPRYNLNHLQNDIKAALGVPSGSDPTFRPDQALVLWLRGFSSDPQHPFVTRDDLQINNGTPGAKVPRKSFFEFDTTRLVAVDDTGNVVTNRMFSYFPQGKTPDGNGAPYVFWDYRAYGDVANGSNRDTQFNNNNIQPNPATPFANAGTAAPYAADPGNTGGPTAWQNPDSFQLIAAGIDGKYGEPNAARTANARIYPSGIGYDIKGTDEDNASNFITKARIGDDRP